MTICIPGWKPDRRIRLYHSHKLWYALRTVCFSAFYSCEQRAKWLLADIWRLPQGSNTPLQSSGVFDSESDTVAFRNFLKEKYGSIDALNDAWGTVFWNQTYTCFGEIYVPRKTLSNSTNPHQVLEHHYPHAVILTKERMEEILCGKREEGGVTLEKYGVKVYKI